MNIFHFLESSLSHSSHLVHRLPKTIGSKEVACDRLNALAQQAKDIEAALMTMMESSDTDELVKSEQSHPLGDGKKPFTGGQN